MPLLIIGEQIIILAGMWTVESRYFHLLINPPNTQYRESMLFISLILAKSGHR